MSEHDIAMAGSEPRIRQRQRHPKTRRARRIMTDVRPTVYVVDDDISVRESLESLVSTAGWEPRTFASAQEFLNRPRAPGPSCLVLDVNLPDLNGLELQGRIADDRMDMPIIMMTGYGDVPMTVRAMKAGAVEFLTKPFAEEILLSAIEAAIDSSRHALADAAELRAVRDRYTSLTRREREVMALLVVGRLNKQVGGELGISEVTVKLHRSNMMKKMQVGTFNQLFGAWQALPQSVRAGNS
jgi:FixJ family two-component response regulator